MSSFSLKRSHRQRSSPTFVKRTHSTAECCHSPVGALKRPCATASLHLHQRPFFTSILQKPSRWAACEAQTSVRNTLRFPARIVPERTPLTDEGPTAASMSEDLPLLPLRTLGRRTARLPETYAFTLPPSATLSVEPTGRAQQFLEQLHLFLDDVRDTRETPSSKSSAERFDWGQLDGIVSEASSMTTLTEEDDSPADKQLKSSSSWKSTQKYRTQKPSLARSAAGDRWGFGSSDARRPQLAGPPPLHIPPIHFHITERNGRVRRLLGRCFVHGTLVKPTLRETSCTLGEADPRDADRCKHCHHSLDPSWQRSVLWYQRTWIPNLVAPHQTFYYPPTSSTAAPAENR